MKRARRLASSAVGPHARGAVGASPPLYLVTTPPGSLLRMPPRTDDEESERARTRNAFIRPRMERNRAPALAETRRHNPGAHAGNLPTALMLSSYLLIVGFLAQRLAMAISWRGSLLLMGAVQALLGALIYRSSTSPCTPHELRPPHHHDAVKITARWMSPLR